MPQFAWPHGTSRPHRPAALRPRRAAVAPALALLLLPLAACGSAPAQPASATASTSAAAVVDARPTVEAPGRTPRLAYTHDGGVTVVDARTLEPLGTFPEAGFLRLNPAGDGRHALVTTAAGWRLLDLGAWTEPHGDHGHSFTTVPLLTDLVFTGAHAGHAVTHAGRTVLFADGTGQIQVFDPKRLDAASLPPVTPHRTPSPHHGVALQQADGTLVHTVGTEESRSGVRAVDLAGREVAATDACPGVHGEAAAADDVVTLGCEDGIVVLREGRFTKVQAPDAYGRIGNQAGSEASHVVLGDYKVDRDAELERPTRVTLTDTRAGTLRVVDLGTSYSFRSLGRGPKGEALVLGTDGALHVLDPLNGRATAKVPVVGAWAEPLEWQDPRPALHVVGATAYVTEPAKRRVVAVDLTTRKVVREATVQHVPNELVATAG